MATGDARETGIGSTRTAPAVSSVTGAGTSDYASLVVPSQLAPGVLGSASIAGTQVGFGMTTRGLRDALTIALGVGIGIVGLVMILGGSRAAKLAVGAAETVAVPAKSVAKTVTKTAAKTAAKTAEAAKEVAE